MNGHVINTFVKSEPLQNKKFCTIFGEPTITQCKKCEHDIRGEYSVNDWIEFDVYSGQFERPSDCSNCGQPFPLTLSRIQAAQELASELEGLTEEERNY